MPATRGAALLVTALSCAEDRCAAADRPREEVVDLGAALEGRVAVVAGGGGGIGSAVSMELARRGATVLVADPGVGVEGEPLDEPTAAATAERINAAGGTAVSSKASVTDMGGLRALFEDAVSRHGSLDIVVNTAGILRYRTLPETTEDDWSALLGVHLGGYLNVLGAALPIMCAAGYGRVVGFTSGVGLARSAGDAMIYGAAKRAVAAVTWQLGPLLPPGIAVSAMSPIAATRMVRSTPGPAGGPSGLDLSAMPQAADMAPAAVHLSGESAGWSRGQVVFSAGSELSLISPPRLLEAVRTRDVVDLPGALATVMPVVLAPAEAAQRSGGGSNPRFGDVFTAAPRAAVHSGGTCMVVADDPGVAGAAASALAAWGIKAVAPAAAERSRREVIATGAGFEDACFSLEASDSSEGPLDAVIVVSAPAPGRPSGDDGEPWQALLGAHAATVGDVLRQAAWLRAAARYALDKRRRLRIVHVTVAGDAGYIPASQAVAQLARSVNESSVNATGVIASGRDDGGRSAGLDSFSISLESTEPSDTMAAAQLAARLVATGDALALRGAELVVGTGWSGVRSHPAPAATVSFGGPDVPPFVDDVFGQAVCGQVGVMRRYP